jgi:hypothetical protein
MYVLPMLAEYTRIDEFLCFARDESVPVRKEENMIVVILICGVVKLPYSVIVQSRYDHLLMKV